MPITEHSQYTQKAKAFKLIFAAQNGGNLASGLSFSAGESQISKDGGSFSNTTNLPAEIGSTGIYSLQLTATEMDADVIAVLISKTGMDDQVERIETDGFPSGTAVTGTLTATAFTTDLTEATDDFWNDVLIEFRSGSLAGQVKKISDYTGSTKLVTVNDGFTAAPSNGDLFVLVNH